MSVDHGIIGLMDPAHGPFVHQAWWWRSRRSIHDKQKAFEPITNGFRMSTHTPSSNSAPYKLLNALYGAPVTTTIDFVLPNMRFEQTRCGRAWFSSRATVTPVRRDLCRLDFCAAWNVDAVGNSDRRGITRLRAAIYSPGYGDDGEAIDRFEASAEIDAD